MEKEKIIDSPWKNRVKARKEVYKMLKKEFGRPVHVGESDLDQCREIVKVAKQLFYK